MKFVVISGPAAMGKMTAGRELAQLTSLRLFHNHLTIELLLGLRRFFLCGRLSQTRQHASKPFRRRAANRRGV